MKSDFYGQVAYGQTSHLSSQLGSARMAAAYFPKRGEVPKPEIAAYTQDRFFPRKMQPAIPAYNQNSIEYMSPRKLLNNSPYIKTHLIGHSHMYKTVSSMKRDPSKQSRRQLSTQMNLTFNGVDKFKNSLFSPIAKTSMLKNKHAILETRDQAAKRSFHNLSTFYDRKHIPGDLSPMKRELSPTIFRAKIMEKDLTLLNNTVGVSDTFGSSFNQGSKDNLECIREKFKPGTIGWNSDPVHYHSRVVE